MLTPSRQSDCIVSSVSFDGKRFAGRCGKPGNSDALQLGIRTLESDWTIIQPFAPEKEGDIGFVMHWSPDGTRLAFVSSGWQTEGVYVLDVDPCLDDPSNCSAHLEGPYWEADAWYLSWSPDGKELAVEVTSTILLYDVKTKQSRVVVDIKDKDIWLHGAAWSPHGIWIGYAADKDNNAWGSNLFVRSPYNGTTKLLTDQDVTQVVGWLDIP